MKKLTLSLFNSRNLINELIEAIGNVDKPIRHIVFEDSDISYNEEYIFSEVLQNSVEEITFRISNEYTKESRDEYSAYYIKFFPNLKKIIYHFSHLHGLSFLKTFFQ